MNRPFAGRAGPHSYEFEPPDLLHVHYEGDVEIEHFRILQDITDRIVDSPYIYILRDARNGGVVRIETRRHIAKGIPAGRIVPVTYGASFQSQTVFNMMSRALQTLKPGTRPAVFHETEAEARAWIDKHRRGLVE